MVHWLSVCVCVCVSKFCKLASFPGSCVGGEKRAWYTLFVHAQFHQDSGRCGSMIVLTWKCVCL